MTVNEIFEHILIISGAFVVGEAEIELNETRFLFLVKNSLGVYSKYHPIEQKSNITTSGKYYEFLVSIPTFVTSIVPVVVTGLPYYIFEQFRGDLGTHSEDLNPHTFVWDYRKPRLYTQYEGTFDITTIHDHEITQDSAGDYEILTITPADDLFLRHLTGLFLIGLGRLRRAFTLNEIPITLDASELVSEGQEMVREALEQMQDRSHFWHAW